MELFGSTEKRINKNKNSENVSHLEISEVVLVHCDIANNDYQRDSRVLHTFFFKQIIWPIIKYFTQILIKSFLILKYGLLIKILKH